MTEVPPQASTDRKQWLVTLLRTKPWERSLRACNEVAAHLVVTLAILISIWVIEHVLGILWGKEGLVLFDGLNVLGASIAVQVKYVFHASDLGVLTTFLFRSGLVFVRFIGRSH